MSDSFDRLPIRVRLAGVSALLTFVILCAFALAIGSLTVHRIRSDFNRDVRDTAYEIATHAHFETNGFQLTVSPELSAWAAPGDHAAIHLFAIDGDLVAREPSNAHWLGEYPLNTATNVQGYRVVTVEAPIYRSQLPIGHIAVQYALQVASTEATVKRVELLLLLGVFIGTGVALLAGMAIARRAMAPIAALTSTAAEIARTRDPSRGIPQPAADDEVAELARTLQGMLRELDAARSETEAMLVRQRQFVADASHELRTPLTSVLANLELLAEALHGEQGEAAASALRSSQRMRRLVGDLLLLARTDAARSVARESCDLAQIVAEAAGELSSVSSQHEISLDVQPAMVLGVRDDLHRLVINLIENALRHTPAGSAIEVCTRSGADGSAVLIVQDNGPGVPVELAPTLFERFVRGSGDRGGSFGLGLAIVHAVSSAHGGTVELQPREDGGSGARFIVRLPAVAAPDETPVAPSPSALADQAV
jgi:signal transduction histidine kinase